VEVRTGRGKNTPCSFVLEQRGREMGYTGEGRGGGGAEVSERVAKCNLKKKRTSSHPPSLPLSPSPSPSLSLSRSLADALPFQAASGKEGEKFRLVYNSAHIQYHPTLLLPLSVPFPHCRLFSSAFLYVRALVTVPIRFRAGHASTLQTRESLQLPGHRSASNPIFLSESRPPFHHYCCVNAIALCYRTERRRGEERPASISRTRVPVHAFLVI